MAVPCFYNEKPGILLKELFSHIKNFLIMWSFPLDFMTISMFVQNRILAHNVNLKSREGNSFIRFYSILRICKWIYSVGNAEPHRTALVFMNLEKLTVKFYETKMFWYCSLIDSCSSQWVYLLCSPPFIWNINSVM